MTLSVQAPRDSIREYWEAEPCGTGEFTWSTIRDLSEKHRERRYCLEPHIPPFAGFAESRGKRVLEIGFGAGTDLLEFARNGAIVSGIDLTETARTLARQRADAEGLSVDLRAGSAEALPWPDETFDLVYAYGVIHHAARPEAVVAEAFRVLKPGGTLKAMLYNRRSLNALLYWLRYGWGTGRPFRTLRDIFSAHLESPGTRAYTVREAEGLFGRFGRVSVRTVVTVFDPSTQALTSAGGLCSGFRPTGGVTGATGLPAVLHLRLGRRRFLPRRTHRLVPGRWGWNHLVTASKPAPSPRVANSTFSQLRKSGIKG